MKDRVGIIIVDYHNETDTLACLDSLAQVTDRQDRRIYVVQPDTQPNSVSQHPLKPMVITAHENRGFAWANNIGITQALEDGCEYLVLLNNDTTVKADFLDPLIEALKGPEVGLVSPKIYFYPGREFHHDEYQESERGKVIWYAGGIIDWQNVYAYHWGVDEVDHGQFTHAVETDFVTGCCLGITKETVNNIGMMDKRYFLYYEDADWSVRAKRKGLKVIFEPKSIIWHKNAGSTGGSGSTLQQHYQARNRIRFAIKYAGVRTKLAVIRESIKNDNTKRSHNYQKC